MPDYSTRCLGDVKRSREGEGAGSDATGGLWDDGKRKHARAARCPALSPNYNPLLNLAPVLAIPLDDKADYFVVYSFSFSSPACLIRTTSISINIT